MVLSLIERVEKGNDVDYPLNYYVDAAKDFNDIDAASDFLNKECPICTATYPIHEVSNFLYIRLAISISTSYGSFLYYTRFVISCIL